MMLSCMGANNEKLGITCGRGGWRSPGSSPWCRRGSAPGWGGVSRAGRGRALGPPAPVGCPAIRRFHPWPPPLHTPPHLPPSSHSFNEWSKVIRLAGGLGEDDGGPCDEIKMEVTASRDLRSNRECVGSVGKQGKVSARISGEEGGRGVIMGRVLRGRILIRYNTRKSCPALIFLRSQPPPPPNRVCTPSITNFLRAKFTPESNVNFLFYLLIDNSISRLLLISIKNETLKFYKRQFIEKILLFLLKKLFIFIAFYGEMLLTIPV